MRQNKRRSARSSESRPEGRSSKKKTVSRQKRGAASAAVSKRVSQGAERVVSSIRSALTTKKRKKAA
ncbi:MAG: hypothetical protein KGQ59_07440 [Bdellovibrionales bacterium]|nr:hypothetical protein [Bdellovibrionales bacterium]